MKPKPTYLLLGLLPLLASCASQPIALAPVGPAPRAARPAASRTGRLQVFTETEEHDDDDRYYFPHRDYEIYAADGQRLRRVWNALDHEDENPALVTLPVGQYVVKASAEFYGLVSVPVEIRPGRTTTVVLQPGWKPRKGFAASDLVQLPNGSFVGWRAQRTKKSEP